MCTARGRAATASKRASDESGHPASVAAGDDHDIAMDRGSFKDGDMDARSEPTLPSEELLLCQYSGLTRLRTDPFTFTCWYSRHSAQLAMPTDYVSELVRLAG